MIDALYDAIENEKIDEYSSVLFNMYEDEDSYTIEASFNDDTYVIGRDHPFVICNKESNWKKVEKLVETELIRYIKNNKEKYSKFDSIAYGFVDGDLNYIRKPQKKKSKKDVHFTAEDFKDFNQIKLDAWLSVYLTEEALESSREERCMFCLGDLSEEQLEYWRKYLADNFD